MHSFTTNKAFTLGASSNKEAHITSKIDVYDENDFKNPLAIGKWINCIVFSLCSQFVWGCINCNMLEKN